MRNCSPYRQYDYYIPQEHRRPHTYDKPGYACPGGYKRMIHPVMDVINRQKSFQPILEFYDGRNYIQRPRALIPPLYRNWLTYRDIMPASDVSVIYTDSL